MTPAALEALGLTVTAGMLFLAGALGAWGRALASTTQQTWSQRTAFDMLVGGCGGIILPIFQPIIDPLLHIEFQKWTALQQSVLALLLGFNGSYFWTAIAWRLGIIRTAKQAATGTKPPPPEPGVFTHKP